VTLAAQAADGSNLPEIKRSKLGLYLTAVEAHALVQANPAQVLFLDVRSRGEVEFLGMPAGADAHVPYMESSEWGAWDTQRSNFLMEPNSDFLSEVARRLNDKNLTKDAVLVLICRSGDRSAKAANLLAEAGYTRVYSVTDGYEGDLAKDGPLKGRRAVNGWKNADLPWSYALDKKKMYKIEQ
jgi:rhodanese-related sulfurtransferase